MSNVRGQFVWFDLMTKDVEAAKRFYGEIAGWKTTEWSGGEYEMWTAGKTQIGGLMPSKDRSPPHWIGYASVDDVDAAGRRARELGGKIVVPGTDIPGVGRFAILSDPQGATFAVFASKVQAEAPDRKALGHISWAELNTTDWRAAWKFYSELLGWRPTQSMDMGPEVGEYFMFGVDPKSSFGGMSNAAKMMKAPPHWLFYINVKSTDETAKRIPQKGGKLLNGPMDVPGGDRIAQCMDPQGAMFAIYSSAGS